jgi:hypothetical protein
MPDVVTLAQYCRDRAARIRALAEMTTLPDFKAQLLTIAGELDGLGRRFRDQLRQEPNPERHRILAQEAGLDRIRQWRMKAEELRTAADQMKDLSAQDSLRRTATTYDKLANDEEARLKGGQSAPTKDAG